MASLASRFLDAPPEVRDEIYRLLLRDEPFVLSNTNPLDEPSHALPRRHEVTMHHCLWPGMLLVNKQTSREYLAIAYERMCLEVRSAPLRDKGYFMLPSMSSYTSLPRHIRENLRCLAVQIHYSTTDIKFPPVHGLRELIAETPALRRLKVHIVLKSKLLEVFCPPGVQVPTVPELFANFPERAGLIETIESELVIMSPMFEQNRSYQWREPLEARIVGEMWLHHKNSSFFSAVRSDGPYTWLGLDLAYRDDLGPSWNALLDEVAKTRLSSGSPYVT